MHSNYTRKIPLNTAFSCEKICSVWITQVGSDLPIFLIKVSQYDDLQQDSCWDQGNEVELFCRLIGGIYKKNTRNKHQLDLVSTALSLPIYMKSNNDAPFDSFPFELGFHGPINPSEESSNAKGMQMAMPLLHHSIRAIQSETAQSTDQGPTPFLIIFNMAVNVQESLKFCNTHSSLMSIGV